MRLDGREGCGAYPVVELDEEALAGLQGVGRLGRVDVEPLGQCRKARERDEEGLGEHCKSGRGGKDWKEREG